MTQNNTDPDLEDDIADDTSDTDDTPSMNDRLLDMVDRAPMSSRDLAKESGVPYWSLYRWSSGKQTTSLKLDYAERLWEFFTGHKFN